LKLLYIGHTVEDYIYINNETFHKGGGLLYSVAAVVSFLEAGDELFPLTNISYNTKYLFNEIYSKVNNLYVSVVDEIPQNHLTLYKDKERDEKYRNITQKLNIKEKQINFDIFDGILVNMVTGFDINLEDLEFIRENFKKKIFMDVHTLSRGIDENLKRYFRKIDNFERWIKNIDILQTNEMEIKFVSIYDKLENIVKYLFDNGLKILLLTKGADGSTIFYLDNNEIKSQNIKPYQAFSDNTVGCGDTYGSIFFYHYIKTSDPIYSANIASKVAAKITKYKTIEEFLRLKYDTEK